MTRHAGYMAGPAAPDAYSVTHGPSGWRICGGEMLKDEAVALAEELMPLADWASMTSGDIIAAAKNEEPWMNDVRGVVLAAKRRMKRQHTL